MCRGMLKAEQQHPVVTPQKTCCKQKRAWTASLLGKLLMPESHADNMNGGVSPRPVYVSLH